MLTFGAWSVRMFTSHLTAIKTTFAVLSALCTFYMHWADIQQFKQCRHHLHASALSIHASALSIHASALSIHASTLLYTPQKGRNAFCIDNTILQSRQTTMPVTGGRIFGCSYSKVALPIQPQTNAITAFTTQPWQAVYYVPMATTRRKVENSAVQTIV